MSPSERSDSPPAGRGDERFPRSRRLTARPQFLGVYSDGRRSRSRSLTLFGVPNGLEYSRVGLTVSRKIGGAVVRNLTKRRLREVFRRHEHRLRPPMDLVVNAHTGIQTAEWSQLEREFLKSFQRLTRRRPEGHG